MQHNLPIDVSVLQPQDSIPEKAPWIWGIDNQTHHIPIPAPPMPDRQIKG